MAETHLDSVLVLGAGKIGTTVADMLAHHHPRLKLTLADQLPPPAESSSDDPLRRIVLDARRSEHLRAALSVHDAVINCLPFFMAQPVAEAAAGCGVHYFDLTEDVTATRAIRQMNGAAVRMPQCGLAPGVIGMLGWDLAGRFDSLYDLRLRVGALTRHATNSLRYNFTWSIDGVINEYCNPADAIVNGERVKVQPLEGHETFTLDAETFEAFNTAGGLGTLCESLQGRARNLDYKTIRYPGHREAISFLLHDLRLIERRDLLRQVLEHAVPHSRDDVVIIFAAASGLRAGRLEQENRLARIYGSELRGKPRTAIELCTAAGVVGVLELLQQGKLPARGFVRQEQVLLRDFLATPAGRQYAHLDGGAPIPSDHEAAHA